jgi:hypothetical protein
MILAVPLALIMATVGTAAAMPPARHLASALWNLPDRLPSLADDNQVHFNPARKIMRVKSRRCSRRL